MVLRSNEHGEPFYRKLERWLSDRSGFVLSFGNHCKVAVLKGGNSFHVTVTISGNDFLRQLVILRLLRKHGGVTKHHPVTLTIRGKPVRAAQFLYTCKSHLLDSLKAVIKCSKARSTPRVRSLRPRVIISATFRSLKPAAKSAGR